jgi:hypothetical protein
MTQFVRHPGIHASTQTWTSSMPSHELQLEMDKRPLFGMLPGLMERNKQNPLPLPHLFSFREQEEVYKESDEQKRLEWKDRHERELLHEPRFWDLWVHL